MGDDAFDFLSAIAQAFEGLGHGAVHNFQHAAAGEQLVFHQSNVRLDARGVAVHQERNRARGGEHGDLRVAIADLFAAGERALPAGTGLLLQVIEIFARMDVFHGVAVEPDHPQYGLEVVLPERLGDVGTARIVAAGEGSENCGDRGPLLICVAGHGRRDGASQRAAWIRIVRQTVTHDERAEIGVPEAQRAEDVGVFGDRLGRVTGVIDDDFLRRNEEAHRCLEPLHVERAVLALELHQVQRREVAGGVVEENIFRARIGGVDRLGAFAGVPFLNGPVVLEARIAADPRAFSNLVQQGRSVLLLEWLTGRDRACPPFLAAKRRLHDFVAHADGQVFVLVHDAAVGVAVVGTVVALLDQRPGFLLFPLFAVDELLDVAMPVAQRVHLRRPARLAARLHYVCHLIVNLQERQRTARATATAELFLGRANRREIGAGAGAVFEEHRLAVGQAHDVFHVVLDRLDKTGAALRVFILSRGALGLTRLAVVIPVAGRRVVADAVMVVETDIEPNRRVERPVLVEAEPGQLVIKDLAVGRVKVTIFCAPVGDGPADAVDQLAHRGLALSGVLLAIKILRDNHFGGEQRPRLGHFDIVLFEDDLATVVGNLGSAPLPLDLVERFDFGITEDALNAQRLFRWRRRSLGASVSYGRATVGLNRGRGRDFVACVNHGFDAYWLRQ